MFKRKSEFNNMSRSPGIASGWFEKYCDDVFPHDYIVVNGKKCKPPRYYDNKFKIDFPVEFDLIKSNRIVRALKNSADNSRERLAVKERVALANVGKLKRVIK